MNGNLRLSENRKKFTCYVERDQIKDDKVGLTPNRPLDYYALIKTSISSLFGYKGTFSLSQKSKDMFT